MICFTLEMDIQEISNLTYKLPEEYILLIKPEPGSDQYFGVIQDDYYEVMLRNLPRESLHSLQEVEPSALLSFIPARDKHALKRQFYGNRNLFSSL